MARFEKRDFPESNCTTYEITDDYGHTAEFSPEQAYHLLKWLFERREELEQAVQKPAELPDWARAESEGES